MAVAEVLWSGKLWFSCFLALLLTFVVALKTTGPTEGRMKWQINLVSTENKMVLLATFIVLKVVLFYGISGIRMFL